MMDKLNKILGIFVLNRNLQKDNKNEFIKTLVKYAAIWIGACVLTSMCRKIPLVKNLLFNLKTILGWYTLAGIALAVLQYLGKFIATEDVEYYSLNDVKEFFKIHQTKQHRIIMIAAIVVLCLIPRGVDAKENKPDEKEIIVATDKEIEKDDISEYIDEQNKKDDSNDSLMDEYLAEEKTKEEDAESPEIEIALSEELELKEAEWVDTPYVNEDGMTLQYNKSMLDMEYSDKTYGNVLYLNGKTIPFPISIADFLKVTGLDIEKTQRNGSGLDKGITFFQLNMGNDLLFFDYISLTEDTQSWENNYIYGLHMYYSADNKCTNNLVLPGGLVMDENADLTFFYEMGIPEGQSREATSTDYVKEGYAQYLLEVNSLTYKPSHVAYKLDFVREALSDQYETTYDAAYANFDAGEEYMGVVSKLAEDAALYGTNDGCYGNVIKMNGTDVKFPITVKDFRAFGFEINEEKMKEDFPNAIVGAARSGWLELRTDSQDDTWKIEVHVLNPSYSTMRVDDLYLCGIRIHNVKGEGPMEIILPGNILVTENYKKDVSDGLVNNGHHSDNMSEWDVLETQMGEYTCSDSYMEYRALAERRDDWEFAAEDYRDNLEGAE